MSIALTVRVRQEQGLSQARLAARAGITLEALRNVESGNKAWPRTIERVARALGLTPMQLYDVRRHGGSRELTRYAGLCGSAGLR